MISALAFWAQQRLSFFEEARAGLWDLWLYLNRAVRDERIVIVPLVIMAVLVYQRFFKKR